MARPLEAARFVGTLTPLTLDELDDIAGGLTDPDQDQHTTDAGQANQVADGAAADQAAQESAATQERFEEFSQDFSQDGDLDQT